MNANEPHTAHTRTQTHCAYWTYRRRALLHKCTITCSAYEKLCTYATEWRARYRLHNAFIITSAFSSVESEKGSDEWLLEWERKREREKEKARGRMRERWRDEKEAMEESNWVRCWKIAYVSVCAVFHIQWWFYKCNIINPMKKTRFFFSIS